MLQLLVLAEVRRDLGHMREVLAAATRGDIMPWDEGGSSTTG